MERRAVGESISSSLFVDLFVRSDLFDGFQDAVQLVVGDLVADQVHDPDDLLLSGQLTAWQDGLLFCQGFSAHLSLPVRKREHTRLLFGEVARGLREIGIWGSIDAQRKDIARRHSWADRQHYCGMSTSRFLRYLVASFYHFRKYFSVRGDDS